MKEIEIGFLRGIGFLLSCLVIAAFITLLFFTVIYINLNVS